MSPVRKMVYLMLSMAAMLFFPWLGGYVRFEGNFPSGFFAFPQLEPLPKPGFDLLMFCFVALVCTAMTAVYVFPKWFGFKAPEEPLPDKSPKTNLPGWFWFGLVCWGLTLILLSKHVARPAWFLHWGDVPLFWGTALMLDGWVYKRTGGNSLVAKVPQELIGIGLASMAGWMIFEFMNFFVEDNWYYPMGDMIDREEFLLYAFIVSSGLLPIAFEWYLVFLSFPKFARRFTNGIKIQLPEIAKTAILVLSFASMFAASLAPQFLFFVLWVAPPIILAIVLNKIGIWTPLDPIARGNWSPALLSMLTYFVTGFCLEGQNYLSAIHHGQDPLFTMTPAYWQYSLPYVDVLHVFEMPLLGYFGYLPFGGYCWLWWIAVATLLNIPAKFLQENPLDFK